MSETQNQPAAQETQVPPALPETPATIPPPASAEPSVTTESVPAQEPVPASWSEITLAFSPQARALRVLDKKVPEDNVDPEPLLAEWKTAWERSEQAAPAGVGRALDTCDGLLIYSVQLIRDGKAIANTSFHARLSQLFTKDGAWDAHERVKDLIEREISFPVIQAVQRELEDLVPKANRRSARGTDGTTQALPAPESEQPEGS